MPRQDMIISPPHHLELYWDSLLLASSKPVEVLGVSAGKSDARQRLGRPAGRAVLQDFAAPTRVAFGAAEVP